MPVAVNNKSSSRKKWNTDLQVPAFC